MLDLLRERFTVEWDPESKGYRKAIRRPDDSSRRRHGRDPAYAALLWLLVAAACVYWHFGRGAPASGFPSRSPDIGGLSVDGMPAGGIAGRGIGCVHADRPPLPEGCRRLVR